VVVESGLEMVLVEAALMAAEAEVHLVAPVALAVRGVLAAVAAVEEVLVGPVEV
jgi:hypothetical protein